MIVTEDLGKQFGDFTAVADVNLDVGKGEALAILGPNGAGKTTTVRMLASILRPTSGRAWVAGYDVVGQPDRVRAAVGVLTENHGLYTRMPAEEYLDFFGRIYDLGPAERRERTRRLLEHFGLQDQAHKPLGQFSKGMRQKLALARALLHDPPVLLLDEPTSAMDPESARLVRDAIHALRSAERTVVICTHNLAEAEELAGQIAIIRHGRIIAHGSPQALKAQMLGPAEFHIIVTSNPDGRSEAGSPHFLDVQLPQEAHLTDRGPNWLRYRTTDPLRTNPAVAQALITQGYGIVSLQETPRNLEQVYLQAMNQFSKREAE